MTDKVNKLTLVIQELKTKDKKTVDVISGTVLLNPEDKKSKTGEMINFQLLLSTAPSLESQIYQLIEQALELKQKQDETNKDKPLKQALTKEASPKRKGIKSKSK